MTSQMAGLSPLWRGVVNMDRFNKPTNNNYLNDDSSNYGNEWEHDDIDKTSELPPVGESRPTPEVSPNHRGRNIVIGAIAIAAIAGGVALFNSSNNAQATAPNSQPSITTNANDTSSANIGETLSPTPNAGADNIGETLSPTPDIDPTKIEHYDQTKPYTDGLSVEEFSNACGFDNLADAYTYRSGEKFANRLSFEIGNMGYYPSSRSADYTPDGQPCAKVLATFDTTSIVAKSTGMLYVTALVDQNTFNIDISIAPLEAGGKIYNYDSDTIPTVDETLEIIREHLN